MDSDFRLPKRPEESVQDKNNLQQTPKSEPEKRFQTPDEAAAKDDLAESVVLPASGENKKEKVSRFRKLQLRWPPNKKELALGVLPVLLGGVIIAVILNHTGAKPVANATPKPVKIAPKVTTVPSTLSGLPVDPSVNKRPVTGVMIENTTDARPQSGLGQAGVVFEAVAEGGVTRFLALYQDTAPGNLGPVRSARPYYVQWAMGFDAGYAHVGGSPDALNDIKAWGTRDLDEFHNAGAYHRISSRAAPHNMYTSMTALNQLEASKGYNSSTFTGFARKKAAPAKVPTVKSISMSLSGPVYNPHYDYNPATNTYNRSEGGAPQVDANTNVQISVPVVIAMVVPKSQGALDSSGAYYSEYASLGSGQVYVFQDGTVTTGTWTKTNQAAPLTFTGTDGKPLKLNPGETWITAISPGGVTYTP